MYIKRKHQVRGSGPQASCIIVTLIVILPGCSIVRVRLKYYHSLITHGGATNWESVSPCKMRNLILASVIMCPEQKFLRLIPEI